MVNPTVFFDIAADGEPLGRVSFEVWRAAWARQGQRGSGGGGGARRAAAGSAAAAPFPARGHFGSRGRRQTKAGGGAAAPFRPRTCSDREPLATAGPARGNAPTGRRARRPLSAGRVLSAAAPGRLPLPGPDSVTASGAGGHAEGPRRPLARSPPGGSSGAAARLPRCDDAPGRGRRPRGPGGGLGGGAASAWPVPPPTPRRRRARAFVPVEAACRRRLAGGGHSASWGRRFPACRLGHLLSRPRGNLAAPGA